MFAYASFRLRVRRKEIRTFSHDPVRCTKLGEWPRPHRIDTQTLPKLSRPKRMRQRSFLTKEEQYKKKNINRCHRSTIGHRPVTNQLSYYNSQSRIIAMLRGTSLSYRIINHFRF